MCLVYVRNVDFHLLNPSGLTSHSVVVFDILSNGNVNVNLYSSKVFIVSYLNRTCT